MFAIGFVTLMDRCLRLLFLFLLIFVVITILPLFLSFIFTPKAFLMSECLATMAASAQDLTPNLVINGLGALMFLCYVAIFLRYAQGRLAAVLRLLTAALLLEALLIAFFEGAERDERKSSWCSFRARCEQVIVNYYSNIMLSMLISYYT